MLMKFLKNVRKKRLTMPGYDIILVRSYNFGKVELLQEEVGHG